MSDSITGGFTAAIAEAEELIGNPPFEAGARYQAALDLWENIDRP